jgi:hypothetical protein
MGWKMEDLEGRGLRNVMADVMKSCLQRWLNLCDDSDDNEK